jgi:hypothetical protein
MRGHTPNHSTPSPPWWKPAAARHLAGAIPVPIYPPARLSQIEDHLRRYAGILSNALATILVTVPEAKALARLLKSQVPTLHAITTVVELSSTAANRIWHSAMCSN